MTAPSSSASKPAFKPEWTDWLVGALAGQGLLLDEAHAIKPLAAEASQRTFFRLPLAAGSDNRSASSAILMHSPPTLENNAAFVEIAAALRSVGVRVPTIYDHAIADGLLLLSDLGQDHLIDAYQDGRTETALAEALATLARIQQVPAAQIPLYTPQRFSDELDIFVDWLVRKACGLPLADGLFEPVRQTLVDNTINQPQICVHRDFHCRNLLMPVDDNSGSGVTAGAGAGVGVVDFQDALFGPAAYDLASLLFDCYWSFDAETVARHCDGYRVDGARLERRAIELLAIQRQLKAIGIFARLALRDNKQAHLVYIEPVVTRLVRQTAHYAPTKALSIWLQDELQPAARNWVALSQAEQRDSKS